MKTINFTYSGTLVKDAHKLAENCANSAETADEAQAMFDKKCGEATGADTVVFFEEKTEMKTKKRELVIQNSIVPVNKGKAIAVIDNETATPVYYCLINSKISKEQAEANAKTVVTQHPHDLLQKGKLYDAMKEQRDKLLKALEECKQLLKARLHLPMGGVDPYKEDRLAVKHAEEAIKSIE